MNEIKIFQNSEFGQVRTVTIDGEPWFIGIDVARVLGYQNGSRDINRHVDEEDKQEFPFNDGAQIRHLIILNESGLYSLIFSSQLGSAKKFKHWVTNEVIPSIRKTGAYSLTASYTIEDPIERAKRWIEEQQEKKALEEQLEEQKPGYSYYLQCVAKKVNTNFRDTAKELNMSQTQLTGWLLSMKYIYRDSKELLLPYEPFVNAGFFVIKDYVNPWSGYSGRQTMITPEGKAHLQLLLESDGINPREKPKHGGRNSRRR